MIALIIGFLGADSVALHMIAARLSDDPIGFWANAASAVVNACATGWAVERVTRDD